MFEVNDRVATITSLDGLESNNNRYAHDIFLAPNNKGYVAALRSGGHEQVWVQFDNIPEVWVATPVEALIKILPDPDKPDMVNHPPHYTSSKAVCSECGHNIECIDVVQHMGFSLGNAVKYIWRADLKNDAIEDLKKAVWYLNTEIALREKSVEQR